MAFPLRLPKKLLAASTPPRDTFPYRKPDGQLTLLTAGDTLLAIVTASDSRLVIVGASDSLVS